jgi:hypothetical protein
MEDYKYDPNAIVVRGGREFKAKDCPKFAFGDYLAIKRRWTVAMHY